MSLEKLENDLEGLKKGEKKKVEEEKKEEFWRKLSEIFGAADVFQDE